LNTIENKLLKTNIKNHNKIKIRMMEPVEINLLVSSNPLNGAKNITPDGSSFEIQLSPELHIPSNAKAITVSLQESTVWWTIANIETGKNDRFYVTGPNTADVSTDFVVVIEQGLYNLSGLSNAIQRELTNQQAKIGLLTLTPDDGTSKVSLRINELLTSVDFSQSDTMRDILGFDSGVVGPFTTVPREVLAEATAQFNTINYFVIHSDIVSNGIRTNNVYDQTLGAVLIDKAPGSQLVSTPFNPPKINAPELAGQKRTNVRFWLTDDNNNLVNTNNEFWSARIVIRYLIPIN
jgi:hypothetical protein